MIGKLLAPGQLTQVGADGLLIGSDGSLIDGGHCFFTPAEQLPALPPWGSGIRFTDAGFQQGMLSGSQAGSVRSLAVDLSRCKGKIDEYRFDTVGRALIEQVEKGIEGDLSSIAQRWRDLLRWTITASDGTQQALPQLSLKVITTQGNLRRATECYLGPDYPHGQIVWRLYGNFGEDEFVSSPSANGLDGLSVEQTETFLLAIGVNGTPLLKRHDSGDDYRRFCEAVIDSLDCPRTVRGNLCKTSEDVRRLCRYYAISDLRLPDRWNRLLKDGDPVALAGYLLSTGGSLLTEELCPSAKFEAAIGSERKLWQDSSVPIPNPVLFYLREVEWVPATDGRRRRPTEIMLSSQGVRYLQGVYARHAINPKDRLIVAHGGREALDSLLTRLGAASSLETLSGQSLYELLLGLPQRDPEGKVAPGIYRTLIESNVSADDSPHRDRFLTSGQMWGHYQGADSYLPVGRLRYNANLTITKAIEAHIPLVNIPRRMRIPLVKQLFGIVPLTSSEIQLALVPEGTVYDACSEEANQHLRLAMPFIYALRLGHTIDERGHDLGLLRKAVLRVCSRAQVSAKLPSGTTESVSLTEPGERIAIDTSLLVVGEYRESSPGSLTFWLTVAELVAELLGTDVADEVGGILRCHTPAEMLEVVRVRLGGDAEEKLAQARDRFADTFAESGEDIERPLPAPKPTGESGKAPSASQPPASESSGQPESVASALDKGATLEPTKGPSQAPPKRRKLVVTGPCRGGDFTHRLLATEDVTFKVVEAFEGHPTQGRFAIVVSHLHGAEGFGCDIISVASEAVRNQALKDGVVNDADVLRYIEVKGRSSRTGEIELVDNEYRAAERLRGRYWLYRVCVDPKRSGHYEIAVLNDPVGSKSVRTVTRFNLGEGSGASWFALAERTEGDASNDTAT